MKRNISIQDLRTLSREKKENLRRLWIPQKYDLAIAYVCTNVETEEYAEIEFCVGNVTVKRSGAIILHDLGAMSNLLKIQMLTESGGEVPESEISFEEPLAFNKEECLPILSIGELIEILDRLHFKNSHFYLLAGANEIGIEIGNFNSLGKNKLLSLEYVKEELCTVLWEMLVAQL